ncbi:MAG: anti-sigma factor family protein [Planctomycetota bacterium]|jgi:anti-sigma factor RsiW
MRLETKLHAFLTDECDDATRREVEELLANDTKARALFEEIREAHTALLLLRDRPAPEAPLDNIQRTIAAGIFAGKPEPEMAAWGTRFYKRVAAAAVILCGISIGFAVQRSLRPDQPVAERPTIAAEPPSMGHTPTPGEISAFDLIQRNNGKLRTRTATDAVMPALELDLR